MNEFVQNYEISKAYLEHISHCDPWASPSDHPRMAPCSSLTHHLSYRSNLSHSLEPIFKGMINHNGLVTDTELYLVALQENKSIAEGQEF